MEGTYELMLADRVIGEAFVTKQGLYWQFDCRCKLTDSVIYEVVVAVADKKICLGVLAPFGDCFLLQRKVAMKHLPKGRAVFSLRERHASKEENFIAVNWREPICYLQHLEKAYLVKRGDQLGIRIEK